MGQSVQVRLEDSEIEEIREIARRMHMTVDEWIQRALLEARRSQPNHSVDAKLRAVRSAVEYEFPTGDIGQILGEIEQGYRFDPPV
jgi:2-methylcitrate dehydratase PrpD